MAVQQWELETDLIQPAPRLELVPAPPRGGRVVPAILFVTLLIGVLAYPAVRAAGEPGPQVIYETPRALPASQIAALDDIGGGAGTMRPTSTEPLGGILFVSCTNLWTALPDGSRSRKLLAFPGISSPAFSPDARTIAFVGPGDAGPALFLAAADGSQLTTLGQFETSGIPISARVSNLSWSPSADKLAFSLVDPAYNPWGEGSTVWTLDLATGSFTRMGQGSPSPSFVDRGVVWSSTWNKQSDTHGSQFITTGGRARYSARVLSTPGNDITFGTMPGAFSDAWATRHGAVVLRTSSDGRTELVTKSDVWNRKERDTHLAPSPYGFLRSGRVSVAQDGSSAIVDLVDPKGDRSMGILDLATGEWTVRDHAWSGVATPVPTFSGPLGAQRAVRLAGDYFGSRSRPGGYTAAALLAGYDDDGLLDGGRGGHILGTPARSDSGWSVPATLYARSDGRYRFQHARFELTKTDDGRLEGAATAISPEYPLDTIEDAKRFLSEMVGEEMSFVWPTYLPAGVTLNKDWPVDAYSYDGSTTATIHLELPREDDDRFRRTMSIAYGDVGFNLGCGGEIDPQETQVGSSPALFDQTGEGPRHTRQILWPGTIDERDVGTYSVYGQLPQAEIERIAESMEAQN